MSPFERNHAVRLEQQLHLKRSWPTRRLRLAQEDGGFVSVGGLVTDLERIASEQKEATDGNSGEGHS
jgi:hypothetical protein